MKFKKLGNTDLEVSLICLGTMTWGTQNTEKEAFEQMDYAVSQGIHFFSDKSLIKLLYGAGKGGRTLDLLVGNETLYH